jgi:hypothetical protein
MVYPNEGTKLAKTNSWIDPNTPSRTGNPPKNPNITVTNGTMDRRVA